MTNLWLTPPICVPKPRIDFFFPCDDFIIQYSFSLGQDPPTKTFWEDSGGGEGWWHRVTMLTAVVTMKFDRGFCTLNGFTALFNNSKHTFRDVSKRQLSDRVCQGSISVMNYSEKWIYWEIKEAGEPVCPRLSPLCLEASVLGIKERRTRKVITYEDVNSQNQLKPTSTKCNSNLSPFISMSTTWVTGKLDFFITATQIPNQDTEKLHEQIGKKKRDTGQDAVMVSIMYVSRR